MLKSKERANWVIFIFVAFFSFSALYYFAQTTLNEQNNLMKNMATAGKVGDIGGSDNLNGSNGNGVSVVIETSMGNMEVEFDNRAPNTVENFLKLARSGFYDGVKFHRVIKGFMIQSGDPLSKDEKIRSRWGTGGPDYRFDDELKGDEKYLQGTLAMANAGPNTNGSQFFIVTAVPGVPLPPLYTVFGKVTKGIDVAMKIENVKTLASDQPAEDVVIKKILVK